MNEDYAVDSEASFFRDYAILYYDVAEGTVCPTCTSGEVYMPMQATVPPTVYRCLTCGNVGEGEKFR